MPPPRFFCPTPLQAGRPTELPEALAHHAMRVLRLAEGTAIILFDGRGGQFPATLRLDGRRVLADVGEHVAVECELRGTLTLIQGIAVADRMDWVVEKAVELGVGALYPIAADRSVLRLGGARLDRRLAHWRAIVQSASAQCGRNRLMQVHEPATLAACLQHHEDHTLICHPEGGQILHEALAGVRDRLNLAIGPEGGWSAGELALAARHGLRCVRFGDRVLRTETAGLALTAATTALLRW